MYISTQVISIERFIRVSYIPVSAIQVVWANVQGNAMSLSIEWWKRTDQSSSWERVNPHASPDELPGRHDQIKEMPTRWWNFPCYRDDYANVTRSFNIIFPTNHWEVDWNRKAPQIEWSHVVVIYQYIFISKMQWPQFVKIHRLDPS